MLAFFLVVLLLHDVLFLLVCLARLFFGKLPKPLPGDLMVRPLCVLIHSITFFVIVDYTTVAFHNVNNTHYSLVPQLVPLKPSIQMQLYESIPSVQVAPFWHGCEKQSSISKTKIEKIY